MTFKMAFSREEVINQEERTPGEQLITLNNSGQRELGSGTLSQWSVDKMGDGTPRGTGEMWHHSRSQGEQLGSLA